MVLLSTGRQVCRQKRNRHPLPTNLGRKRRYTDNNTSGAEERAGDVEERVVDLRGASEPS